MIVHMIHNSIVCHFLLQMHSLPLPALVIPRGVEGGGVKGHDQLEGGHPGAVGASLPCWRTDGLESRAPPWHPSLVQAAPWLTLLCVCVCVVSSRSCTCAGAGSAAATEAPEDAWHWDREHQTSRDTGGLQQRVCRGQKSRWGTGRAPGARPLDFFFSPWLWARRGRRPLT